MHAGHSAPLIDCCEPDRFRAALRTFATGVTVVTSAGGAGACGITANAFTSVSLTPPLVLVCLSVGSSARTIAGNGVFAVNILSAGQEWLSQRFARSTRPRGRAAFRDVPHRVAVTGAPLLDGAAGWLECRLCDLHEAGDHRIAVGEVLELAHQPGREPLVFHAGRYRRLAPLSSDPPKGGDNT